jgi:hypothetical protein
VVHKQQFPKPPAPPEIILPWINHQALKRAAAEIPKLRPTMMEPDPEVEIGEGEERPYFFPSGTKEQYEASIAAVHPSRSTLPKGQIFHAAGPTTGGWQIVAIHDSKESWERFRDSTLLPQMQKGIPGGFTGPPQENGFEVHNLQK